MEDLENESIEETNNNMVTPDASISGVTGESGESSEPNVGNTTLNKDSSKEEKSKTTSPSSDSKPSFVADVMLAIPRGSARAVEDTVNTIGWVGQMLQDANVLPVIRTYNKSSGTYESVLPRWEDTSFLSDRVGKSKTGTGNFIEEASRFATGFVTTGGAAGRAAKGAASLARYAPNFAIKSNLKTPQVIANAAKALSSGKAGSIAKTFADGSLRGAATDFVLTNKEDELLSDLFLNTHPVVRDTVLEHFANGEDIGNEEESMALLRRKLQASAEGIFVGGAFNVALDKFVLPMARAIKAKGLLGANTMDMEQQVRKFFNVEEGAPDPIVGKKIDGNDIVLAKDPIGRNVYTTSDKVVDGVVQPGDILSRDTINKLKSDSTDPLIGKEFEGSVIVKAKRPDGKEIYVKQSDVAENGVVKEGVDEIDFSEVRDLFPEDEQFKIDEIIGQVDFQEKVRARLDKLVNEVQSQVDQLDEGSAKVLNSRGVRSLARLQTILQADTKSMRRLIRERYAETTEYANYKGYLNESMTFDQVSQIGRDLGFKDLGDIQKEFPGASPEQIAFQFFKVQEVMKANSDILEELAMNPDNPLLMNMAKDTYEIMGELLGEFADLGSQAGRSLSFYGKFQKVLFQEQYKAIQMARLTGTDIEDILTKANAYKGLDEAQKRYLQMNGGDIAHEMLYSVYVSNLLSGTTTHAINFISTAFSYLHKTIGRSGVAILSRDAASRAGARQFLKKSFSKANFIDSYKQAMATFREGQPPLHLSSADDLQKVNNYRIFQQLANNSPEDSWLKLTLGLADAAISAPGKALNAGDVFFRNMTYNSAVVDNISSRALREGLNPAQTREMLEAVGTKDFSKFGDKLQVENLFDRVIQESKEVTYTMDSNGIMKKLASAIDMEIGGFKPLKFVMPFHRIGSNLVRYHIHNTPGLNRISPSTSDIFLNGTIEAQERKMGEIFATSSMMLSGAMLMGEGVITGRGPRDPAERSQLIKTGWRPYAVKIPGIGYVEMKRLGPIGVFFQIGGMVTEAMETMYDNDGNPGEQASEMLISGLAMMSDIFTPEFVSQGLPEFFGIFDGDESKAADNFTRYMGRFSVNTIPLSGYITRNSRLGEQLLTGASSVMDIPYDENLFWNEWKRAYPWFDSDIRPQVDMFGNDRDRGVFSLNKDADLIEEYERLSDSALVDTDEDGIEKAMLLPPPRKDIRANILGESTRVYKLNNDEYYRYQKYAAGIYEDKKGVTPPFGKSFKQKWRDEMNAGYPEAKSMYGSDSDEAIVAYIRFIHKQYRDVATAIIRSEKQVSEGIGQGVQEKFKHRDKMLRDKESGRRGPRLR